MSGHRLVRLYHPSLHVPDLDEAEDFFGRVFARRSRRLSALGGRRAVDYCTFTPIADLLVDSIDPRRYVLGGRQRYPTVDRPSLRGLGWYVEGIDDLYRSLLEHGFTVVDQLDRVADGDGPPTAAGASMPLFFTVADDAGLRHELLPVIPFPLDPRLDADWVLPPVSTDDPLGIVRCAHHTVLTNRPDRALRLVCDVFGGTVVHAGRDDLLGATVTSVHLGDSILRLAVPDDEGRSGELRVGDRYHGIAWLVTDLDRVEHHLRSEGVGILARTEESVVADPATALGVPWRFTTEPDPGDPLGT